MLAWWIPTATHQHVLRALCDFSVEFQEVRALEGLEPKVIVVVIPLVVDVVVQNIGVGHDDFVDLCRDEGGVLVGFRVDVPRRSVMTSVKLSLVDR